MQNNTPAEQPKKSKKRPKIIMLVVLIIVFCALAIIIHPIVSRRVDHLPAIKCFHNLQYLYVGMLEYEAEFKTYPTARGIQFWETLRNLPTPETSILKNQNKIFVCPLAGHEPGKGVCDYRGPNFQVSDEIDESTPIGADFPDNHPDGSIFVLYWNGKIDRLEKGDPKIERVDKYLSK